jgi:hypothetical protein
MNQPANPQVDDRLRRIHSNMVAMTNVLKLAQFAAEARRTLQGIDDLGRRNPEVATAISNRVESCNEWTQCEDVLCQVLGCTVNHLERDQDELDRVIGAMHPSANTGSAQDDGEVAR